ncbi:MAG: hypothetical protein NVSMB26_19790 [Beijerinckiaceae bacterium]
MLPKAAIVLRNYVVLSLSVGLAFPAYAKGPADQGFKKLTGPQIRAVFVGKVFSDDTHFSNRYKADGTIDGVSMGKKISNKWKIVKDTLCITDSMDELCYAVWLKGKDAQLVYENTDVILTGSVR